MSHIKNVSEGTSAVLHWCHVSHDLETNVNLFNLGANIPKSSWSFEITPTYLYDAFNVQQNPQVTKYPALDSQITFYLVCFWLSFILKILSQMIIEGVWIISLYVDSYLKVVYCRHYNSSTFSESIVLISKLTFCTLGRIWRFKWKCS